MPNPRPSRRGERRVPPPPPPPPETQPPDAFATALGELKLAAIVAFSLTVVVLARRWATTWLGTDTLNAEILAGGSFVNELVSRVGAHVFPEPSHDASSRAAGPDGRSTTPAS